ncbi:uncharacterized protein LOC132194596 [Neocloeon triangulifer]|uniref:uncharacterized protein LOC132194596 n=1 Tax=Neocloeon triangulifer TaxID=2078957 RepID=UPI00286EDDAC|nr:uncharacterized protein LOC132194596 [Neocloeon triangulifer]
MRLTPSRILFTLIIFVLILTTWLIISHSGPDHYIAQNCQNSEEFQDALHKLAKDTHDLLTGLGLTHALCYGALWGQIRMSRTLPWENDVEFCVLNEELMQKDEASIFSTFRRKQLQLSYDSVDGIYTVTNVAVEPTSDLARAVVKLIVFEEDSKTARVPGSKGMLRRVGWKRRVMPPDCEGIAILECFPPNLVTPPLPERNFGGFFMPVPREGVEIQKYHYIDNWWKEVIPKNC